MDPISQATEIVRQAEGELRQWLLRAAERGDYETARKLAEWASRLKQMVHQNGFVDRKPSPTEVANEPIPEPAAPAIRTRTNTHNAKPRRLTKSKRTKAAKGEYPKFLRDGEELLKIGWSKRQKAAYRHRAPKRVVLLVAQAIQRHGQDAGRFGMEQVLPIRDSESHVDLPSYQVYLSLAWFRRESLIVQHGRQGYSLRPDINLTDAAEERWKLLPGS